MLKSLTHLFLPKNRFHNLQNPNPTFMNPDVPRQHGQGEAADGDEDDGGGEFQEEIAGFGGDHAGGLGDTQTASSSGKMMGCDGDGDGDGVGGVRVGQMASSSGEMRDCGVDGVGGLRDDRTALSSEIRLECDGDAVEGDGEESLEASSSERRKGVEDDFRGDRMTSSDGRAGDDDDDDDDDVMLRTASSREGASDVNGYVGDELGVKVKSVDEEAKTLSTDDDESVVKGCSPEKQRMEAPPLDDCCPICFGDFVVPCRGPCGHWYCGGCILQYWNYASALKPCNCPMCSRKITKLTPEASLCKHREAEVLEVLKNVNKYNHLFVGGPYGLVLKVFELPVYVKRMFRDMINPDRPHALTNNLRLFAIFLGLLYSISPFDFLRIGCRNAVDIFDTFAIALSLFLYVYGLYVQRRRLRRVRELAAVPAA